MPRIDLKPRKTPRQQRSAEMVEIILQAATRVLERESLAGFNTNRVAEVAGISVGSLYQYFPNKAALTAALIDRTQAALVESLRTVIDELEGAPLATSLHALARLAVRQQYAKPLLAAALDHEEKRLPVHSRLRTAEHMLVESVERLLARHRAVLARNLPAAAAQDCLVIAKALVEAEAGVRTEPPPDLEARIVRALWGYLTTAAPKGGWRRRDVIRLGVGGLAAAWTRPVRALQRDRPPNLIVILSDNHRADAMGCAGHAFVQTPHLDRLAREGVRFVNAFCTTPLCSPARASFLTGLYATTHGVRNNSTLSRWNPSHPTFLEVLQRDGGYATAFIGKWHMPASGLPTVRGVDHFVTFTINDGQGQYFDCPLMVDGVEQPSRTRYLTDELTDRALAWLSDQGDRPFCLYLAHKAAHYPWSPAPEDAGRYAGAPVPLPDGANRWTGFVDGQIWGGFDRSIPSAYRSYMETLTSVDRAIGRLLAHLDTRGVARDTAVVYASDNGFLFGEHGKVELRWPYDEVLRIPFLLRLPRAFGGSQQRAQMALNLDLAPTLLELAGVPPPAAMQGRSLVPVLRDPAAPGRRAWMVENWKEFPYRVPAYAGVRTEQWLYVEYEGDFRPTLHDMASDRQQRHDLFDTPAGARAAAELTRTLAALRAGTYADT